MPFFNIEKKYFVDFGLISSSNIIVMKKKGKCEIGIGHLNI